MSALLEAGRNPAGAAESLCQPISPRLQRSFGHGTVEASGASGATRLKRLREDGCARIRLPNTHDKSLQAVLINTSGGLTGGDELSWNIAAEAGAQLVVTTPACERIYRTLGDAARITTRISAGRAARIDWLPQETILFEGSRLARSMDVELAEDATFCAVEAVLLGREAMGESARNAVFADDWRIRRNGRLVHAEATRLSGAALQRDGISLLAGANAFATVLYAAADAESRLEAVRALLIGSSAASAAGERLIVRALAPSGMLLRRILAPVVAALCGAGALPRLWLT